MYRLGSNVVLCTLPTKATLIPSTIQLQYFIFHIVKPAVDQWTGNNSKYLYVVQSMVA